MDDRSPAERSRTMAAIRSRDTTPELRLRSALHRRGVRFRLGQKVVLSDRKITPDLVFRGARIAVFVDGCYWHACPDHFRMPSSNTEYWQKKIQDNQARDHKTDEDLESKGWTVLRFWEHQAPEAAAIEVRAVLAAARTRTNSTCK